VKLPSSLANALEDAGVVRRAARVSPGRRVTARAWLTGALDAERQ
jgi:hypothetical protein